MRAFVILIIFFLSCSTKFTFNDAEKKNTIDAYYRFITENPDSPDVDVALSKIKDMLFTQAVDSRDILLIKRFISEFPSDPRSVHLRDILDELRFEEAKKKNTKTAFEIFLHNANNKELKLKARECLFEIEYDEVKNSNDPAQIELFLTKNKESRYYNELNERLMNLLFEKISSGDIYYAESFIERFPEDKRKNVIFKILINNVFDRLSLNCLMKGANRFVEIIDKSDIEKSVFNEIVVKIEKNEMECNKIVAQLKRLTMSKFKKGELKSIFLEKSKDVEINDTLKLIKNYYNNYLRLDNSYNDLSIEDVEKRRLSYLYLKSYPLNPQVAFKFIDIFMNSTLFERVELAEILKALMVDETNGKLFNLIFLLYRDKPIYSVIRGFFFDDADNYEKENSLLNKAFINSKEDLLLQHLLLEKSYKKGYSSFIKSVMNEHINQLFSVASELQSSCVESCPQKILFDIKGIQIILRKEAEIAKITFGEKSDIFNILVEKEKEISRLLEKNNFALGVPVLNNPSEQLSIDLLNHLRDKSLLRIIYQSEPDPSKREKIKKLF